MSSSDTGGLLRAAGRGDVRGTQSFVHIMARVFRRPSLTLIELAWRAVAAIVLILTCWKFTPAVPAMTTLNDWQGLAYALAHGNFSVQLTRPGTLICLTALALWTFVATLGRRAVLTRMHGERHGSVLAGWALSLLQAGLFIAVLCLWAFAAYTLARHFVWQPEARGEYPGYVAAFALLVICSTVLFIVWSLISWVVRLGFVVSQRTGASPAAALRASAASSGALRSKLVEINFVMGIVRVALLVLALTFSASPLPFQSVETQGFLVAWWAGVAVLYVVASDYFHVVRTAVYLELWSSLKS